MSLVRMSRLTLAIYKREVKYPVQLPDEIVITDIPESEEVITETVSTRLGAIPMSFRRETVTIKVGVQIKHSEIEVDRVQVRNYIHTLYETGADKGGLDANMHTYGELAHELLSQMEKYYRDMRISVEVCGEEGGYSIVGEPF